MSRSLRVRFASLAAAISLAAVAALTLSAVASANPIVPPVHLVSPASGAAGPESAMRTPSPEAGSIPSAMTLSGDLVPRGLSLPGVIAVLAVAALMGGVYLAIPRGYGATRRVHEQQLTIGKAVQPPSAVGPTRRAA